MSNKKFLLALSMSMLICAFFVGCNGERTPDQAESGERTTITFWNGFTGPDGPVLQMLVDEFNETNENGVYIDMDIMPWDVLFQRLATVLAVQEGPDIIAFATEHIGTYALPGAIAPIGEIFSSGRIDSSVIPPYFYENLQFNGQHFGVPMNFATLLLYYNKDLFEAAGLDPERPPASWDELEDFALRIRAIENMDVYGFGLAVSQTIPMWPIMVWGGGGDFIQNGRSVLNSEANVATITRWADLIVNSNIAPPIMTGAEIDSLFASGRLGMYFVGPWATTGFTEGGLNFGVAPAPAGPAGPITLATGVAMVMTSSSQNQEAVFDFFEWWNSPDTQVRWSLGTGFPLARTDVLDDPRLEENPFIIAFSSVANDARFHLQQLTNFSQIESEIIVPALETILLLGADVRETLDRFSADLDTLLD